MKLVRKKVVKPNINENVENVNPKSGRAGPLIHTDPGLHGVETVLRPVPLSAADALDNEPDP